MTDQYRTSKHRGIHAVVVALAMLSYLAAPAVELGPRAEPPGETRNEQEHLPLPPLRLAIPLLDPGVPSSEEKRYRQGIWPELRNAESVRIAVKLKEEIAKRNTFREVVVTPDASASADFYLLVRIDQSNAEDLKLRWRLMDATQAFRIPGGCTGASNCWRRASHRIWNGWHDVHDSVERDPFVPLYGEIADRVHREMVDLARRHEHRVQKNRRLAAKGRATKQSELEAATTTRSVLFAAFFAPDLYGDAVERKRGRVRLAYLPAQNGDDWARIESIRARDERFAELLSDQYEELAEQMHKTYAQWQQDNFPLAREARLARREATWSAVAGAIGAAGAVAAAADEGNPHSKETAAVLAAASAAAIANSVIERKKLDALRDQINEIGATAQGSLKPMVVATRDRTVTLTGTAREQFQQWRALLQEIYVNTANDLEAVRFVDDS